MNLSNKNKRILENILNCTIEFDSETDAHEVYIIKRTYSKIIYNKKEKYYYIASVYINKLSKCNEIIIITVEFGRFHFVFTNDLKNIKI